MSTLTEPHFNNSQLPTFRSIDFDAKVDQPCCMISPRHLACAQEGELLIFLTL